jgi:hypothetical protein
MGTVDFSPGVNMPEFEVDQLLLSIAKVNKE